MSSKEINNKDGVVSSFKKVSKHIAEPVKFHGSTTNIILWLITIILVIAGIASSQYYSNLIPNYLELAVTLGIIIVFLIGFYFTNQGKKFFSFMRSSIKEITKIHWPSRNEVVQTSLIVIAITVVVALFFFLFDSIITWLINLITTWKF